MAAARRSPKVWRASDSARRPTWTRWTWTSPFAHVPVLLFGDSNIYVKKSNTYVLHKILLEVRRLSSESTKLYSCDLLSRLPTCVSRENRKHMRSKFMDSDGRRKSTELHQTILYGMFYSLQRDLSGHRWGGRVQEPIPWNVNSEMFGLLPVESRCHRLPLELAMHAGLMME